jgi:hypothetical protein
MQGAKTEKSEVSRDLSQFRDAFRASASYCKPQWEKYLRMYKLWRGVKPPEVDATISRIWINMAHAMVQNRTPLIKENVFSHPEYMQLKSDSPDYDFMRIPAQTWLRDLLEDKIQIRSDINATITSALFGGTGFRMPSVHYMKVGKQWLPKIGSRDLDFFNVLPSPNGGLINPTDAHRDDAVDWVFVIDWWTEEKIEKVANKKGFNKEQIGKLLEKAADGSDSNDEDQYRSAFKTVNGLSYEGYGAQLRGMKDAPSSLKKRRVIHWFRRDVHIVVAEDAFVIYRGTPPIGEGIIPAVKYSVTPDMKNFYGISQIEMVEDLIMATVMNVNYRFDHALGVMFPTTWIRDDLKRGMSAEDFMPRPYAVNFFPDSVSDIRNAIHYDRRPEVGQQTFMDEDRLKAFLQGVSGELETTGSMNDVVGNRSATGVTTIASQLKARPNMEAGIIEEAFREECTLLLKLGAIHINKPDDIGAGGNVRTPFTNGSTPWTKVSPEDITDNFTVQMYGARFMANQSTSFQKMMALYPMLVNNPAFDQLELTRQVVETADILPDLEKALVPPAPLPVASPARPSASMGAPGGAASVMDGGQAPAAMQRENAPPAQEARSERLGAF